MLKLQVAKVSAFFETL